MSMDATRAESGPVMKANYFTLTLDTTGPFIEVLGLDYSIRGALYDITVISNEPMDPGVQNCNVIDSAGKEHPVTLAISEDGLKYEGSTQFEGCAVGIATIIAQMRDDVGNLSNVSSKAVNILTAPIYHCNVDLACAGAEIAIDQAKVSVLTSQATVKMSVDWK